jgi:tetratricopeptide (TPR) repeat protein
LRKGPSFWLQPACQPLTAALLFACVATVAAQPVDTADEVPAISRAVAALIKTRHFSEAEALANKGLALCAAAAGARGLCLGQFNDSLGDIAYLQQQYSRSLHFFQKAVEAREGILDSGSVLILASQVRLGRTYLALNRIDEAEPLLKKAIEGLNHAAPISPNLGIALESLRRLYAASGRIDEEVGVRRSELEFYEKADGRNVERIQRWKLSLNDALVKQAKSLSARKNEADAERALLESIKLIDPPPPGAEKYLSVSLEELGIVYHRQRRFAEAEPLFLRALEYRAKLAGPSDPNLPIVLSNVATLYQDWGKHETSIQYALRAIAKFDEAKIEDLKLGVALLKLGQSHGALRQIAEAESSLLRAKHVLDHFIPEKDPVRIKVRLDLGALYISEESYAEAERSFQSALELEQKYPNPNTYWRSEALAWLGAVYRDTARYDEAERLLSEAVKLEEMVGDTRKA